MFSPSRLAVLFSLCVIVVIVFGVSPVHGKKKSKNKEVVVVGDTEGKGACANVSCTKAPDGLTCTRTAIKNPSLLKRLGALKDCCPAWRCQDTDGSYSTYFGMSGDATPDSFNGEHEQYKDGKGETNDKCVEAKAVCPKPDGNDKCVESNTTEAHEFKPRGDLDSCCPTYNCTKTDGSYHIHFAMTGGTMPALTDADAVAKQKGTDTGDKKCSNIVCAPKPESPDDGPVCKPTTTDDSSRISSLGPFRECCNVWKCAYDDGSYYVHFELQAPSFWVADTSFYSELPEVPGDGVTIVYEESDEAEPEATAAMMSVTVPTTSTSDGDGNDDESDEDEVIVAPAVHRAFKPKRHHKKKRKQTKMDQQSSQILTVIVNNGNSVNASLIPGNQGQVMNGQDPSAVQDSSRVVMVTTDQGVPPPAQASGVQFQSYQYQEQYQQQQQLQQAPPQQVVVQQDPNSAQMQSLQALNVQQMQQMQNMNMQNMQNLQNINNAQMQAMMVQQNGPVVGPPMYR